MSFHLRPVCGVLSRASARGYCVPRRPSNARSIHSDSSSLYVHWPYCEKRCTYCNFNKYISRSVDHSAMTECLIRELATVIRSSGISAITTVFFGGGTPSLMRPQDMERVLQAVAALTTTPVAESLVSDAELASLGRTHSVEDGLRCVEWATHLFPGQVSVDVLYGRPGQTLGSWTEELRQVVLLGTAHVSLYELTVERGTQLFKDVQAGLQVLPDSETCSQMYLAAVEELEQEGLLRYEVSNFARKGHECQHNQACWRGSQYLGIGPGAHSRLLVGEGRWEARVQTLEPDPWMREVTHRGHGTRLTRMLTQQERLEELLLTGLRTARGICDQEWCAVSGGVSLVDTFTSCAQTARLIDAGLLVLDDSCLHATKAGMNVADSLVSTLLPRLKDWTWA
ncbi:radical S-adenosyl methionine domain-containing protein 1, mitochondrial-like isoform X2 [Amblyomma americanum]